MNLLVEAFNDIVGADPCPVYIWKIAIGSYLHSAVFYLLGGLLQLHYLQFTVGLLTLLGVDRLKHPDHLASLWNEE